jgi:hypothetical protein
MIKRFGYLTVDLILDEILKTLPLENQEKIKKMTVDEFCFSEHFKLGTTIKDKYFYKNKAREQLVNSLGNKKEYIFLDGDVFSQIILEKLYERITSTKK